MADENNDTATAVVEPDPDAQELDQAEWDRQASEEAGSTTDPDEGGSATDQDENQDSAQEASDKPADDSASASDAAEQGGKKDEEQDEAAQLAQEHEANKKYWETIERVHPEARKINGDPKFVSWFQDQPEKDRKEAESDAVAGIAMVTRYQRDLADGKVEDVDNGGEPDLAKWIEESGLSDFKINDTDEHDNPRTLSILEAAEEYDVVKAQLLIGQAIEKRVKDMLSGVEGRIPDVSSIEGQLADYAVLRAHPDADKIAKTKKFDEYRKGLDEPFRKLWDEGGPKERIAFLNRYKADQAKGGAGSDDIQGDRRRLHQDTMRGGGTGHATTKSTGDGDESSFDEEWDKVAAEEKKK